MQQIVNLPSGYAFFPSAFRMGDRYFSPGYYRVPEGNSFLPGEFYAPCTPPTSASTNAIASSAMVA